MMAGMPKYSFRCTGCDAETDIDLPSDLRHEPQSCPGCGEPLRRRFSPMGPGHHWVDLADAEREVLLAALRERGVDLTNPGIRIHADGTVEGFIPIDGGAEVYVRPIEPPECPPVVEVASDDVIDRDAWAAREARYGVATNAAGRALYAPPGPPETFHIDAEQAETARKVAHAVVDEIDALARINAWFAARPDLAPVDEIVRAVTDPEYT
jgi:putative FmdB family regulatory protein